MAHIHILKEDGSGDPYDHPGRVREPYFKLPHDFWRTGSSSGRWYRELSLAEVAMLLVSLSLLDRFRLPAEDVPKWYGISADTAGRGFSGLAGHGLLEVQAVSKVAPLSPVGYTFDHLYTLRPPFGPKGRVQKRRAR